MTSRACALGAGTVTFVGGFVGSPEVFAVPPDDLAAWSDDTGTRVVMDVTAAADLGRQGVDRQKGSVVALLAVEKLADRVDLTDMPGGLLDHVDQHPP
jgi:hypothetical protein